MNGTWSRQMNVVLTSPLTCTPYFWRVTVINGADLRTVVNSPLFVVDTAPPLSSAAVVDVVLVRRCRFWPCGDNMRTLALMASLSRLLRLCNAQASDPTGPAQPCVFEPLADRFLVRYSGFRDVCTFIS
jgi:hypothetical protein